MEITPELWSEYLVAFWDHPVNFHQYFRNGVDIVAGDVVIDCGACEGFFTRKAIEKGASLVICVEPSEAMACCLERTFSGEISSGKVVIVRRALGSFSGTAGFSSSDHDAFAGQFDSASATAVEVTTLAAIAQLHGDPTFIKMDLEGSEYQALVGGHRLLEELRPKLGITTYHNPWDFQVILPFLKSVGYHSVKPYGVTFRNSRTPRPVMAHAW